MKAYRIVSHLLVAQLVLLVPLIGMLVSDDIDWSLLDFAIVSMLLAVIGVAFYMVMNRSGNLEQNIIGFALGLIALLVFAELAVDIFGTPFAGSYLPIILYLHL